MENMTQLFTVNGEIWKREDISFEEFLEAIHSTPDCWMFKDLKNPQFWKWSLYKSYRRPGEKVTIYELKLDKTSHSFKIMPEYNEVWHKEDNGLWSTWKDLD